MAPKLKKLGFEFCDAQSEEVNAFVDAVLKNHLSLTTVHVSFLHARALDDWCAKEAVGLLQRLHTHPKLESIVLSISCAEAILVENVEEDVLKDESLPYAEHLQELLKSNKSCILVKGGPDL